MVCQGEPIHSPYTHTVTGDKRRHNWAYLANPQIGGHENDTPRRGPPWAAAAAANKTMLS